MIKDILVNLPVGGSRDSVTSFAASVAASFGAHMTGVGFLYEPLMPVMVDMYGVPPDVIESQRIENEKAAKVAVGRFDEAARLAGISGEAHALDAPVARPPAHWRAWREGSTCQWLPSPSLISPRWHACSLKPRAVRNRPTFAHRSVHPNRPAEARSHHGMLGRQPQRRRAA
jgi:hypothetical protein